MRIAIVGSVAAGTSVGAKARRNTESAQKVIYERDSDISYSGCGLPSFVGGEVESIEALTPRDPAWFASRCNIDMHTRHEVTAGVFTVRTPGDAAAFRAHIEARAVTDAVVVGAGILPNTVLARQARVALGASGAIAVGERMATNVPGSYAVGDDAESFDVIKPDRSEYLGGPGDGDQDDRRSGPASVLPFIAAQLVGAAIGAAQTELFHPRPGRTPEPLELPRPVHDRT